MNYEWAGENFLIAELAPLCVVATSASTCTSLLPLLPLSPKWNEMKENSGNVLVSVPSLDPIQLCNINELPARRVPSVPFSLSSLTTGSSCTICANRTSRRASLRVYMREALFWRIFNVAHRPISWNLHFKWVVGGRRRERWPPSIGLLSWRELWRVFLI